ncbi:hypothetical protein BDZ85DRAFT_240143 [Elsinoe ampelina]|uniref:ubiquitinyl hydrolase 1 n=1 Tax=Elsinoe ampelina TaxID=302913 RepID=A0A6A6G7U7_9PEZI|nr:hypothetical protein BDZ85DRAFT_240143 [Elsinoe ampelina]
MVNCRQLFNHVVLPHDLPVQQDYEVDNVGTSLSRRLSSACDFMAKTVPVQWHEAFQTLHHSLNMATELHSGHLNRRRLENTFEEIRNQTFIVLHVSKQNAAIIIRQDTDTDELGLIFEVFETSVPCKVALRAADGMQWDFPGRAVRIPMVVMDDPTFRATLAIFLERASMEDVQRFQASVQKAAGTVTETRDVTAPGLIAEMLFSILEAVGSAVEVPVLRKRIRDDVSFLKTGIPWRRHPFWLVLRVAAQRYLCLTLGARFGRILYKLLMAVQHSDLLRVSVDQLAPESVHLLKSKICRRMAKLTSELSTAIGVANDDLQEAYRLILERVRMSVDIASTFIEHSWAEFRRKTIRPVPLMPLRASVEETKLALHNSGQYLDQALQSPPAISAQRPMIDSLMESMVEPTESQQLVSLHMKLEEHDRRAQNVPPEIGSQQGDWDNRVLYMAGRIEDYTCTINGAYDGDPCLMSSMLLTVFEMWVTMDTACTVVCPLVKKYHPAFTPNLLDTLQLPRLADMTRLARVQNYLKTRCDQSDPERPTIFSAAGKNSFAYQYCMSSESLQDLLRCVRRDSNSARQTKEWEWQQLSTRYTELTQKIDQTECTCTFNTDGSRNVKGCTRCWHWRTRKRLQILVHEDFLPDDDITACIIAFQLGMPDFLRQYKDSTWKIINDYGRPNSIPDKRGKPVLMLGNYRQLRPYNRCDGRITLASRIKSHLNTHYKLSDASANASSCLKRFGPRFEYFDRHSSQWMDNLSSVVTNLTFFHHCGLFIPQTIQDILQAPAWVSVLDWTEFSSYQIQANRAVCPRTLTVHEFSAQQRLFGSRRLRWPTILVELGAANLNFSSEDTMLLVSSLAIQAGPGSLDTPLREYHSIFQDVSFTDRLSQQIDTRLDSISSNRGELYCMELLITLSLRCLALGQNEAKTKMVSLLRRIQKITLDWTRSFGDESNAVEHPDGAQVLLQSAAYTALLCRMTFQSLLHFSSVKLSEPSLAVWVEASLRLQEGMPAQVASLPPRLKRLLTRDAHSTTALEQMIGLAMKQYPQALQVLWSNCVANDTQTSPDRSTTTVVQTRASVLPSSDKWIHRQIGTDMYSFEYLTGKLLVNGKVAGKLPQKILDNEDIKELFGDRTMLVYPSNLPGMTYRLQRSIEGHVIHIGLHTTSILIQAHSLHGSWQHVSRRIFEKEGTFDLPKELLSCVHWLNIRTNELECRRKPDIWRSRPRDWKISIRRRQAVRGNSMLICPYSDTFAKIYRLMEHFEKPIRITVYVTQSMRLRVALRDLELSFRVNNNGLLESQELHSEIDSDQDAGTLYGLQSALVLRDTRTDRRSILFPLDLPSWHQQGIHVNISMTGLSGYGRFDIDEVMGRLKCPPEPRLLYMKALLHALTSFVTPDPLTKKTGTEEALAILTSSVAQPWAPLAEGVMGILQTIQRLSPTRQYYPADKKVLQKVSWNDRLPFHTQHDAFHLVVQKILDRSFNLGAYKERSSTLRTSPDIEWLRRRAAIRRMYRERENAVTSTLCTTDSQDLVYQSRDKQTGSSESCTVYAVSKAVLESRVMIKSDYHAMMCRWDTLGGNDRNTVTLTSSLACLCNLKVGEHWFGLLDVFMAATKYEAAFLLGVLTFNGDCSAEVLSLLGAYNSLQQLKNLEVPDHSVPTKYLAVAKPKEQELLDLIVEAFRPYVPDRTARKRQRQTLRLEFGIRCQQQGLEMVQQLLRQWPEPDPVFHDHSFDKIDTNVAAEALRVEWRHRLRLHAFTQYVKQAQSIVDGSVISMVLAAPRTREIAEASYRSPNVMGRPRKPQSLAELIEKDVLHPSDMRVDATINEIFSTGKFTTKRKPRASDSIVKELRGLVDELAISDSKVRKQYANDIMSSLRAASLGSQSGVPIHTLSNPQFTMRKALEAARALVSRQHGKVKESLRNEQQQVPWLLTGQLWPSESFMDLAQLLRSSHTKRASISMRSGLIDLALALIQLQRVHRMQIAYRKNDLVALSSELTNTGHENWDPSEYPDWLLIELEGSLMIRPEQVEVAEAVIRPSCARNCVLQMNMGQGKTSVICPMVMAILANRLQLARLIVPRPLVFQTVQVLHSRLGMLAGREISHFPFDRRTACTEEMLNFYEEQHRATLMNGGIIVVSPESLLSSQLNSWQLLLDGKVEAAQKLLDVQRFFDTRARDVIDESDFVLGTKTQLIYPSGAHSVVDGSPWRWDVAEKLFELIEDHIGNLQAMFPRTVVVVDRSPGFPLINFLSDEPETMLLAQMVEEISRGQTSVFRFAQETTQGGCDVIKRVLTSEKLDEVDLATAVRLTADQISAAKVLLTGRGLLLHRIISLCLRKRWNVQYGLDLDRCPVAVPFEAKGVPSERAEFGHPDVTISLTCLSFYYQGLSSTQFKEGLAHVLRSDDPAMEFGRWTASTRLPATLSQWNLINLADHSQLDRMWKCLRLDRTVINHYLNQFVFPIHMKQFAIKLQASAWDIALIDNANGGDADQARTTGFSGTNDNRIILPSSIQQEDLPSLVSTNAEVLGYFLEERNHGYHHAADGDVRLTENAFLKRLAQMKIRVLIDAGAYVMEMDNNTLAEAWLKEDHEAKAAVYFGRDHRIWVKYRGKSADVPLVATPFVDDLSDCVIYLDECHTRGVDLKFPEFAIGALTLALGQTKDHTVQAAMRLRQLSTTQSIKFFAPPDVHQSLLNFCRPANGEIKSHHVVAWLLDQTCENNENMLPLHVAQGLDFCARKDAVWEYAASRDGNEDRRKLLSKLCRREGHTLASIYGSESPETIDNVLSAISNPALRNHAEVLFQRNALIEGRANTQDMLQEVEQEREVEFQVEEVREIEGPARYRALRFPGLHPALCSFAATSQPDPIDIFDSFASTLIKTKTGMQYGISRFDTNLFVSDEFGRSIEGSVHNQPGDEYLRPVEWVLWCPKTNRGIVVIPEEADLLMDILTTEVKTAAHLLSYAAPVTKQMQHFSKLNYFAIPALHSGQVPPDWLAVEVGILAGRMYFLWDELDYLKRYLGFNKDQGGQDEAAPRLCTKQADFLLEWLALRRGARDILCTPMGYVCQRRTIKRDHAFFTLGA